MPPVLNQLCVQAGQWSPAACATGLVASPKAAVSSSLDGSSQDGGGSQRRPAPGQSAPEFQEPSHRNTAPCPLSHGLQPDRPGATGPVTITHLSRGEAEAQNHLAEAKARLEGRLPLKGSPIYPSLPALPADTWVQAEGHRGPEAGGWRDGKQPGPTVHPGPCLGRPARLRARVSGVPLIWGPRDS